MRNKKQFIIDKILENNHLDLKELSVKYNLNYSHVTRTFNDLRRDVTVGYSIYCVRSIDRPSVFFIFSGDLEKKITVKENQIMNDYILTPYEKYWLKINKNFN